MFSFDLSDTNKRHVYIDGVEDAGTWTLYVDANLDFTGGVIDVGAAQTNSVHLDGDMADLWLAPDVYIDFSDAENRMRFIKDGKPVYLGDDGSKTTGIVPHYYLTGDTEDWHTNNGAGGGFTENGALRPASSTPPQTTVFHDGLIGYWKLDETSGTTVIDYASANNGTWNGAASVVSANGPIGRAFEFDMVDDYINVGEPAELVDVFDGGATITAWFYPRTRGQGGGSTGGIILDKSSGGANPINGYGLRMHSSGGDAYELSFGYGFSVSVLRWFTPDDSIKLNQWQHVALTYDANSDANIPIIYIDGVSQVLSGLSPSGTRDTNAGNDFVIGGRNVSRFFDGRIDDVRVYDRILSGAEITELYQQGVCDNPTRMTGTIIHNVDYNVVQFCNGDDWVAMGPSPGAGGAGCSNPARGPGSLIYNKTYSVMQYCDGTDWVAIGKKVDPCDGSPAVGALCGNGSVYAGLSTAPGTPKMFVTDMNQSTGTQWKATWPNDDINPDSDTDGAANHANVTVAMNTLPAMDLCETLDRHGHQDWYLPAKDELNVLYTNRAAINISAMENFNSAEYWSSTDRNTFSPWRQSFIGGGQSSINKDNSYDVRCVRHD